MGWDGLAIVAAQYVLGILTIVYDVSVSLAVAHQALALIVLGFWVAWMHHVHNLIVLVQDPLPCGPV